MESITNDDIRFIVDAEQMPFARPVFPDARGAAHRCPGNAEVIPHPRGGATGWAAARVDRLVVGGRTATLTAIVTKPNVEEAGARLGISVQQGGKGEPDRLGFSWGGGTSTRGTPMRTAGP
ncbi:hypothetical protein OG596_36970 [Streptomyces sp. NBC_01102]|uniref:hypothetical protein n=1 Tax=Streptomyces sp. NBC_01102 TaxID=2903749 RepID=UPI00386E8C86|nr:hypothetical protein OG596_36970 [Streptomyces sp. NBC_01102]